MFQYVKNRFFASPEKFIFFLIVLLNLIPVFSGKFFPTLDGPAHLYNAQLVNHLVFEKSTALNDFFVLNPEPVPNWTGHFILSFFSLFLPAFAAEKILLLFYLIGLPLGFRAIVLRLAPDNRYLTYLIFPFTYSFIFFLGFYNFCIALVFLMIAFHFWLKHEQHLTRVRLLQLTGLLIVTYFSHVFVFCMLLLLIGLHAFSKASQEVVSGQKAWRSSVTALFKKGGVVVLAALIPLVFFAYYVYKRQVESHESFIPFHELMDWLKNMRPIIAMNIIDEEVYTKKLLLILELLVGLVLLSRIRLLIVHWKENTAKRKFLGLIPLVHVNDYLIIVSLVLLCCFFILPDSNVYVGYVTTRLGLLFFMFLALWLAVQAMPKWIMFLVPIGVLYCHFESNEYYKPRIEEANRVATECAGMSKYIQPNSVVLPLGYSTEWSYGHFSNYLGIEKNVIVLENYECTTGYFPVKWNVEKMPGVQFGDSSLRVFQCLTQIENELPNQVKADYVFMLGDSETRTDSCTAVVQRNLKQFYVLHHKGKYCRLYRLRK